MKCVLFAKKNRTLKKYWEMAKNTGKVREFCQSRKVGTLTWLICTCMKTWSALLLTSPMRTTLPVTAFLKYVSWRILKLSYWDTSYIFLISIFS